LIVAAACMLARIFRASMHKIRIVRAFRSIKPHFYRATLASPSSRGL